MKTIEEIEAELAQEREELSRVEGTPPEVYSRIVGYYRSVRNWNTGKREEYGERRLFSVAGIGVAEVGAVQEDAAQEADPVCSAAQEKAAPFSDAKADRVLLFVRKTCPACPPAKAAAEKLGLPVDYINTDSESGIAEAVKHHVLSTPTAIFLKKDGSELRRAFSSRSIAELGNAVGLAS